MLNIPKSIGTFRKFLEYIVDHKDHRDGDHRVFQTALLWNHWQNANSMITDGMMNPTVDNTNM